MLVKQSAFLFDPEVGRSVIVPRDYQNEAHDRFIELADAGTRGVMFRIFTGGGKTLCASLVGDTWLRRGDDYRLMVVSYEKELVWQFAREVEKFLGITPAIEMGSAHADPNSQVVVASRQSLLAAKGPTGEQVVELNSFGIRELGAIPKRMAEKYLKYLRKGGDPDEVRIDIASQNEKAHAQDGSWSRMHRFDWKLNWLLVWDEAHRHKHKLDSVGPVVDYFFQNEKTRQLGLTATPKCGDGTNLSHKMFPGIAIDYPLYTRSGRCAVNEGYAVPYIQKYIEVQGVDFRKIKRLTKGGDFDEGALAEALGTEEQLTKLVGPLLDLVGDRRCLIFSPTVEMAKDVARYINARSEAKCECGLMRWYPTALIGDGATCDCGRFITQESVTKKPDQANEIDGEVANQDRKTVYDGHKSGKFQFLSVCGLCREGYDDPGIACVAVFRPVSKKASSLAEQMKGRSCRPAAEIASILHTLPDAEARRRAVAESVKPNALIVDLVGITGLADCASTVDIYAEGLPDEVRDRAQEILADAAVGQEMAVEEAIEQAQRESDEAKENAKQEREEAERLAKEEAKKRAEADAKARYTEHDVGHGRQASGDPNEATEKQYKFIASLGMDVGDVISRRQAGRIIDQLKAGVAPEEVARTNRLHDWKPAGPSEAQGYWLQQRGIYGVRTKLIASKIISAGKEPERFRSEMLVDIAAAENHKALDALGGIMKFAAKLCNPDVVHALNVAGRQRRSELNRNNEEPIPD